MSEEVDSSAAATLSAGGMLRRARESAGWSIDTVSQQLKLAPRQVRALEEDDYARLPGRTFVRGFLRNYARVLRIDADAVLRALPETAAAASLERPALPANARTIADLPAEPAARPSSARFAIPLALVAIVAIAAAYQFGRPLLERNRTETVAPARLPAPVAAEPAPAPAPPPVAAVPDTPAAEPPTIVAPVAPGADTPLVFAFRGTSWIEVRDAKGAVVLSTMGYPGATHAVAGPFPLDVVLGNAEAVGVTLRGEAFDTVPFQRQNVARFQVR